MAYPLDINPTKVFETTTDGDLTLQSVFGSASVGTGISIVAAVTGKKIKVMGWKIFPTSDTVNSYFTLKAGSTVLVGGMTVDANGVCKENDASINVTGYGDTGTNQALTMDVIGSNVFYTVFYLVYT